MSIEDSSSHNFHLENVFCLHTLSCKTSDVVVLFFHLLITDFFYFQLSKLISIFTAIGRLCEKCDGKCVICDSYVRPSTLVRICDECNYGSYQGRCVICGGQGVSDAYYCKECTICEKDRDGCPKIINIGAAKTDMFYEKKKYGFKAR